MSRMNAKYFSFYVTILHIFNGIYGAENSHLIRKMLETVLKIQPKYRNDLKEGLNFLATTFNQIQDKVNENNPDNYDDITMFILDCAYTIHTFVTVLPDAIDICSQIELEQKVTRFYGIALNQLCDGENDCGDFSDEQSCNINECDENVLCAHICTDKPVGYECTCYKGYRVSTKDRHLCEDINECLNRPCSQICTNTRGNYHCSCVDGYELKDRHVCKSVADVKVKFIFTNKYYIREVEVDGKNSLLIRLLIHNLSNAVALDYDYDTKCYYWSDVTSLISKIQSWCPDQNVTNDIHHTMLKNPDGLSVDWVAKNLYWCDKGLDTIEVSRLDGKYRRILIKEHLQEPRSKRQRYSN